MMDNIGVNFHVDRILIFNHNLSPVEDYLLFDLLISSLDEFSIILILV